MQSGPDDQTQKFQTYVGFCHIHAFYSPISRRVETKAILTLVAC